jgi:hypothetical protein
MLHIVTFDPLVGHGKIMQTKLNSDIHFPSSSRSYVIMNTISICYCPSHVHKLNRIAMLQQIYECLLFTAAVSLCRISGNNKAFPYP